MRSSAAAVVAAEQGVRQGAQFLNMGVRDAVIPSVKRKVPAAKGIRPSVHACSGQLNASYILQYGLGLQF